MIETKTAVEQSLTVLREGFEGTPNPWSLFTDGPPESALFGTLAKLSPAEASKPVGGSSIAAHAHHTAFGLEASTAFIRGDRNPRDWKESWKVSSVDAAAWTRLQADLRQRYTELCRAIESHAGDSVEAFAGAVGAIAHVAYHLGAIRQKAALK